MRKIRVKLMMFTIVGLIAAVSASIRAEAHVPDNVDTSVIDEDYEEVEEDETVQEMGPLTPDGNLTIVDDYGAAEQAGKQFITVTTKDGNIFYIIIDRDDSGENTVHFLNLVDEQDLMALLDDDEKEELEKAKEAAEAAKIQAATPTDADTEIDNEPVKAEKKSGKSDILVICIVVGMAAVAGLYFYSNKKSFIKKKTGPIIDDDEEYIEIPSESADKDYEDVPVE